MPTHKQRIFIVDDHFLISHGLSSLLDGNPDFEVTGICNKPLEVLDLLQKSPADILLTDIRMPGMSGIELTGLVLKKFPRMRVLALSMHSERQVINEMINAGISGYVLKDTSQLELITALKAIASGQSYFSPQVQELLSVEDHTPRFTEREIEIIRLIAKQYSSRQIGETLFISERTVESHRRNILRKTEAVNTAGLVQYAYQNKLI